MYTLSTLATLRDLDITVYRGSRFIRFHVYENKHGRVQADIIQRLNWWKDSQQPSHIKNVLLSPEHGITALIHLGYSVESRPAPKGSDLALSEQSTVCFNRSPAKRLEALESESGLDFDALLEYTRSKEFHEHAKQNILKYHCKPKLK